MGYYFIPKNGKNTVFVGIGKGLDKLNNNFMSRPLSLKRDFYLVNEALQLYSDTNFNIRKLVVILLSSHQKFE
jgi:hypothetical protein